MKNKEKTLNDERQRWKRFGCRDPLIPPALIANMLSQRWADPLSDPQLAQIGGRGRWPGCLAPSADDQVGGLASALCASKWQTDMR